MKKNLNIPKDFSKDKSSIIEKTIDILKPQIFNGISWIADHRRIRIVAHKKNEIN